MSQLTDALNRIQVWLTNNCPPVAECITPGLCPEEIQAVTRTLPFSLSEEVYELYQWSRGHNEEALTIYTSIFDPREGMSHCSLERAIEILPTFEDAFEECAVKYIGKPLFPIFEFDGAHLCVIGDWEDKKSSPIIFVSEINEIITKYISLTSMMLTLAESFELGIFSLDEKGYTKWNEEKFSQIYIRQNFCILEFSLKKLKQELILRQHDLVLSQRTIDDFRGDIACLDRDRRYLATKQLDIEVIKPLLTAMQDEDERIASLAKKALEELNYNVD